MIIITVQEENNKTLENLIKYRYFNVWRSKDINTNLFKCTILELIITYDCNLKCEYCYVHNFGKDLYPYKIRNRQNILNNLKLFLDFLIKDGLPFIWQIAIFTGEIWNEDFGYEVLEILYQFLSKHKITYEVIIPSNCTFILDEKYKSKMQEYVDKFNNIGIPLKISASVDGYLLEDKTRAFKNSKFDYVRNEKYYDDLFNFIQKNKCGYHPMVSAYGIDKWLDNYKWWNDMAIKYGFDKRSMMMLEVRNNDWDEESLKKYEEYLTYQIDYLYNDFNDMDEFCSYVFKIYDKYKQFCNISLNYNDKRYKCGIQKALSVRLGDLAIVPCHRLSYEKFLYGHFKVENNEIVGYEGKNVALAMKLLLSNPECSNYQCDACAYNNLCMMGCLGSQYENTGEIFNPPKNMCAMLKRKIDILISKYKELGIIDHYKNMHLERRSDIEKRREILGAIDKIDKYNEECKGE